MTQEAGWHYRRARERITELLEGRSDDEWTSPVPACPGWRVRDVVAHLRATVDDGMAGRLTGPPSEDQTAEQVARYAGVEPAALLHDWNEVSPPFEDAITALEIWPAALDALSHEHDIRGALGAPGGRDDESVQLGARRVIERLELDVPLSFDLGDEVVTTAPGDGAPLTVTASAFEVFRFRLGRRTPDQVRALPWSDDPTPILADLFIFGPAEQPIAE